MTQSLLRTEPAPPTWEIEWKVVDVVCRCLGCPHSWITPDARLGSDIGADSLDMVEITMEIENAFQVRISDELCQSFFTRYPVTLRQIAQAIQVAWGQAAEDRKYLPPPRRVKYQTVPFTQLGGRPSKKEYMEGQLYELLGRNRQGQFQFRRRTDGMRCVLVPGAEAWIGSNDSDSLPDQRPAHWVQLDEFLIDTEPVSTLAFSRFLSAVGLVSPNLLLEWCHVPDDDQRRQQFPLQPTWRGWKPLPGTEQQSMMLVSWYGANAYALWANRRDWRWYRGDGSIHSSLRDVRVDTAPPPVRRLNRCLPSEAEWEYAARGAEPRRFPWLVEDCAPERPCTALHRQGTTYTASTIPSASVSALLGVSPFGLHHMAGNVWQWCRDWYAPEFYHDPKARRTNPENREPTGIRSERGGSWVGPDRLATSSYRRGRPPWMRGRCLGFRCVGLREDLP